MEELRNYLVQALKIDISRFDTEDSLNKKIEEKMRFVIKFSSKRNKMLEGFNILSKNYDEYAKMYGLASTEDIFEEYFSEQLLDFGIKPDINSYIEEMVHLVNTPSAEEIDYFLPPEEKYVDADERKTYKLQKQSQKASTRDLPKEKTGLIKMLKDIKFKGTIITVVIAIALSAFTYAKGSANAKKDAIKNIIALVQTGTIFNNIKDFKEAYKDYATDVDIVERSLAGISWAQWVDSHAAGSLRADDILIVRCSKEGYEKMKADGIDIKPATVEDLRRLQEKGMLRSSYKHILDAASKNGVTEGEIVTADGQTYIVNFGVEDKKSK